MIPRHHSVKAETASEPKDWNRTVPFFPPYSDTASLQPRSDVERGTGFRSRSPSGPDALMSLRLLVAAVIELTVEEKTTMPRTST